MVHSSTVNIHSIERLLMKTESPFKSTHEVLVVLHKQSSSSDFSALSAAIEKEYYKNPERKERVLKFGRLLNDHCCCIIFKVIDDAEFQELLAVLLAFENEYEAVEIIPFLTN